MNKVYSRIDWKNYPALDTPLNETNLNKMDSAVDELDNRIIGIDTTKVSNEDIQNLIKSWTMDEKTGIITITKVDGSKDIFDLNIEKIPVSFILGEDGVLTMITDDGSVWTANIGSMIPILTFSDSDTIAVSVTGEGVNKTYTFSIKNNSVTDDMIEANYLANIKVESEKAKKSADDAEMLVEDAKKTLETATSIVADAVFTVNDETGELEYESNAYTFSINEDGVLEWEVDL